MKPLRPRWGRLHSLLILTFILVVMVCWAAVGPAEGASPTTTLPAAASQESSFTVKASDLGDFGAAPPKIESASAIVINQTTGKVLYERNADVQRPMASTTKIMTGILVLEQMDLGEGVVVSLDAAMTSDEHPWLREGDVLTVEEMLYALMVRSSNPAAVALAEACSGSLEAFVEEMNDKAAELGMDDTHFIHPSGLDRNGHYSTAADMAVLGRYAMQNEKFRELVSTEEHTIELPGRDPVVCETTNKLLKEVEWVTGVKTGLTPKAKQCLVGAGSKDGVNVISVVLGQPSSKVCWAESEALMEYGFSQYRYVDLIKEGATVAVATVPYELDGRLELVTASGVGMELFRDESVTASVELDKPLTLPVSEGEVFGQIRLTVDGKAVGEVDLVATESYGETTLGSKVAYFWRRLGRVLGRVF
ncbi:MAG: D-alanyl-D-alanine carboxypeptidase [Thermoleophilia bacterium]|nr:D-alanyl-D-alanine carboxypeptidase [Thermoleophilia bacterium]